MRTAFKRIQRFTRSLRSGAGAVAVSPGCGPALPDRPLELTVLEDRRVLNAMAVLAGGELLLDNIDASELSIGTGGSVLGGPVVTFELTGDSWDASAATGSGGTISSGSGGTDNILSVDAATFQDLQIEAGQQEISPGNVVDAAETDVVQDAGESLAGVFALDTITIQTDGGVSLLEMSNELGRLDIAAVDDVVVQSATDLEFSALVTANPSVFGRVQVASGGDLTIVDGTFAATPYGISTSGGQTAFGFGTLQIVADGSVTIDSVVQTDFGSNGTFSPAEVTAGGDLVVTTSGQVDLLGSLLIDAGGDLLVEGQISAGEIAASIQGDARIDGTVEAIVPFSPFFGDKLELSVEGGIDVGGVIRVDEGRGSLFSTGGDFTLDATGTVAATGTDGELSITAGEISLAGTTTLAGSSSFNVVFLFGRDGVVMDPTAVLTSDGSISVRSDGDVTLRDATAANSVFASVSSGGGAVEVVAGSTITAGQAVQIVTDSQTSGIVVDGDLVSTANTGGLVELDHRAAGPITVNGDVSVAGGDVTIRSVQSPSDSPTVMFGAGVQVRAAQAMGGTGGTVEIDAAQGTIDMAGDAVIDADRSVLLAANDVNLGQIIARPVAGTPVSSVVISGDVIRDADTTDDSTANITANFINFLANDASAIWVGEAESVTPGGDVDVDQVGQQFGAGLHAQNQLSRAYITDLDGDLYLDNPSRPVLTVTQGRIESSGLLRVGTIMSINGGVDLVAAGSASVGDNVQIDERIFFNGVNTLSGDRLTVSAGDDIRFGGAGAIVVQRGSVDLIADAEGATGDGVRGSITQQTAGTPVLVDILGEADVTLSAHAGIGVGNAIETQLATIDAVNTGTGGIAISEADGLAGLRLDAAGQTVNLTAGGDVLDSDASVDVDAQSAVLAVNGAAGDGPADRIQFAVDDLSVDTVAADGDQFLNNDRGLAGLELRAGTGVIDLVAAGAIADADTNLDIAGSAVSIVAGGAVGTDPGSGGRPIQIATDSLSVDTSVANGDQFLAVDGGLAAIDLRSGTGSVVLAATGTIADSDAAVDVQAALANLRSIGGTIGDAGASVAAIQTDVTSLTAAAVGDIAIIETDDLSISAFSNEGAIDLVAGDGGVSGDLTVGTISADADAAGAIGDVSIATAVGSIIDGDTTAATDIVASAVTITAGGGIGDNLAGRPGEDNALELSAATITAAGGLLLGAVDVRLANAAPAGTGPTTAVLRNAGTGSVRLSQTGGRTLDVASAEAADGEIVLDNATGDLLLGTTAPVNASDAVTATTTGTGDVIVGRVVAGNQVTLDAAGDIADGTVNDAAANVTASQTELLAGGSIGAGDDVNLETGALAVMAGGDMELENRGDLTVSGLTTGGGGILETAGSLTFSGDATSGDDTAYRTIDSPDGSDESIAFVAGGTVSAMGDLTLESGDDIAIDPLAVVDAIGGVLSLAIDVGDADGSGAAAVLSGTIGGSAIGISLSGGTDDDAFLIDGNGGLQGDGGTVDKIGAAVTIDGGGGDDTVRLDDSGDTTGDIVTIETGGLTGLATDPAVTFAYTNVGTLDIDVAFGAGGDNVTITAEQDISYTLAGSAPAAVPGDAITFVTQGTPFELTGQEIRPDGLGTIRYAEFESFTLSGDVILRGSGQDDLLTIESDTETSGTLRLVRDVTGATPDRVQPVRFDEALATTAITFLGLGGDDVLVLEQPSGRFLDLSGGVAFDGGRQDDGLNALTENVPDRPGVIAAATGDAVLLTQTATVVEADEITYRFADVANTTDGFAGTITIDDATIADGSSEFRFVNVEPFVDRVAAASRRFVYEGRAETITLSNNGMAGLDNRVQGDRSNAVSFDHPAQSLTIDATAGTGGDAIFIDGVGAGFVADLTVTAGIDAAAISDDALTIRQATTLGGAASLAATADRINIAADIDVAGNVDLTTIGDDLVATAPVNVTAGAALSLQSGADVRSVANVSLGGAAIGIDAIRDIDLGADTTVAATGTVSLNAARDVSIRIGSDLTGDAIAITTAIGDIAAGDGATVVAITDAQISAAGAATIGLGARVEASGPVRVSTANGALTIRDDVMLVSTAESVQLIAAGGSLDIGNRAEARGETAVTLSSTAAIAAGSDLVANSATQDVAISANGLVSIGDRATLTAATDATVTAASATFGETLKITAGRDAALRSLTGAIAVGDSATVLAGDVITVDAAASFTAGDRLTLDAASIVIDAIGAVVIGDDATVTAIDDATVTAGNIVVGDAAQVTAGGGIQVRSTTGSVAFEDAASLAAVDAIVVAAATSFTAANQFALDAGSITIDAGGAITIDGNATLNAVNDIAVAGSAVAFGDALRVISGSDVQVRSTIGSTAIGEAGEIAAAGVLTVDAGTAFSTGDQLTLDAASIAVDAGRAASIGESAVLNGVDDVAVSGADVTFGDMLLITAGRDVQVRSTSEGVAVGDLARVAADGAIAVAAVTSFAAGNQLSLDAASIDIDAGTTASTGVNARFVSAGTVDLLAGDAITIEDALRVTAGGDVRVRSANGFVAVGDSANVTTAAAITVNAATSFTAGDQLTLDAASLNIETGDAVDIGQDSMLTTETDAVILGAAVTIGDGLQVAAVVDASFESTSGAIALGEMASVTAGAAITVDAAISFTADDRLTFDASSIDMEAGGAVVVGDEATLTATMDTVVLALDVAFGSSVDVMAGGEASFESTSGAIALGQMASVTAGAAITVDAATSFTAGDQLTFDASSISMGAGGAVVVGDEATLTAMTDVVVEGADVTFCDALRVAAGRDVRLRSTMGATAIGEAGEITAAGRLSADAATSLTAGDRLTLDAVAINVEAGSGVVVGSSATLRASDDAVVVGAAVTISDGLQVTAGGETRLRSTSGAIAFGATASVTAGDAITLDAATTFTAGDRLTLDAASISMEAGSAVVVSDDAVLNARGNIAITGSDVAVGDALRVAAGSDVRVRSTIGSTVIGESAEIAAAGELAVAATTSLAAGDQLTLDAASIDIAAGTTAQVGDSATITSSGAINALAGGAIGIGGLASVNGSSVDVRSTGGRIDLGPTGSYIAAGRAAFEAAEDFATGTGVTIAGASGDVRVDAGSDVILGSANDLAAATTLLIAGGRDVQVGGNATLNANGLLEVTAGRNLLGAANVAIASAGSAARLAADGAIGFGDNATITAADQVDVISGAGLSFGNDTTLTAGTQLSLDAVGAIRLGERTTLLGEGVSILSGSGPIAVGDASTVTAGSDIELRSSGDATVGVGSAIDAGRDVSIVLGGDLMVRDVAAVSAGGVVDVGAENATLQTGSTFDAGDAIQIRTAADFAMDTSATLTAVNRVEVTAGGALSMTDGSAMQAGRDVRLAATRTIGVAAVGAGDLVRVSSSDGAIEDTRSGEGAGRENIVSSRVLLDAATGIGDSDDIDINADLLGAVNRVGGTVRISETDDVALLDGTIASGDTVANVGRLVELQAGGSLTDATATAESRANVTAGAAVLLAGGTIGEASNDLNVAIDDLRFSSGRGAWITQTASGGDLRLVGDSSSGATADLRTISGDLTVDGSLQAASRLSLAAGGADADAIVAGTVRAATGDVRIAADDHVAISGTIEAVSGDVAVRSNADSDATGDNGRDGEDRDGITMATTGVVRAAGVVGLTTQDGPLVSAVPGGQSVDVATLVAGNSVRIIAGGEITDSRVEAMNPEGANIVATAVSLQSGRGIGINDDVDLAVDRLAAVAREGVVRLENRGDLQLASVGDIAGLTVDRGAAPAAIDIRTLDGDLVAAANVVVNSGGGILLAARGMGDAADGADLILDADVTARAGLITLWADDHVAVNDIVSGRDVRVRANADGSQFGDTGLNGSGADGIVMAETGRIVAAGSVELATQTAAGNVIATPGRETILLSDVRAGETVAIVAGGSVVDNRGAMTPVGEAANVTAASLVVEVGTGIGDCDANDLDTRVRRLAAITDSGDIRLTNAGDLTIASIDAAPISAGERFVSGVRILDDAANGRDAQDSGTDQIEVTAAGGMLTVATAVVNGDAASIRLAATESIALLADVASTTTSEAAGAITVAAGGGLSQVGSTTSTRGADVLYVAGGSIAVRDSGSGATAVAVAGQGDVLLDAGAGLLVEDGLRSERGSIGLQAVGQVTIGASDGDVTIDAGGGIVDGGVLVSGASVAMVGDAAIRTTGGNILVETVSGDVALAVLEAARGTVAVSAAGDITNAAQDGRTNIASQATRLEAGGAIGQVDAGGGPREANAAAITTAVDVVAAAAREGIFLSEADNVRVDRVDGFAVRLSVDEAQDNCIVVADARTPAESVTTLADLESTGQGAVHLGTRAGDLVVADGDADGLGVRAAGGDVLLQAGGAAGRGDIAIASDVSGVGGRVTIDAAGGVTIDAGRTVSAMGPEADVVVVARDGASSGGVTMAAGSAIAATRSIALEAGSAGESNLLIASLNAGDGVDLSATGSILDANGAALNISATQLRAVADSNGVGGGQIGRSDGTSSEMNAQAIDTAVEALAARATDGIAILETNGGITVGETDIAIVRANLNGTQSNLTRASLADVVATAGDVRLRNADGDITLTDSPGAGDGLAGISVAASGDVLLESAAGDVVVMGGADVRSSGGFVAVRASEAVQLGNATIGTAAAGTVELIGDRVLMQDGGEVTTAGGDVRIAGQRGVTIGRIDAGAGSVSLLSSDGLIEDAASDDQGGQVVIGVVDIVASGLLIDAIGAGTASDRLEMDIDTIAARVQSGGLFITEQRELAVDAVSTTTRRPLFGGGRATTIEGSISDLVASDGGSIDVRTAAGGLSLRDGDNFDGLAVEASGGGSIRLASGGNVNAVLGIFDAADSDLQVAADVRVTGGGDVELVAGGDVLLDRGAVSVDRAGDIGVRAGETVAGANRLAGDANADVVMTNRSGLVAETGEIEIEATRDIYLSRVVASGGRVILSADDDDRDQAGNGAVSGDGTGRIVDVLAGEGADGVNIVAAEVQLLAGSGIGSESTFDQGDIDLNADLLAAQTDSGSIVLRDVGDVTIGRVVSRDGVVLSGATVLDAAPIGADVQDSKSDIIDVYAAGSLSVAGGSGVVNNDSGLVILESAGDLTIGSLDASGGPAVVASVSEFTAASVADSPDGQIVLRTLDGDITFGRNVVTTTDDNPAGGSEVFLPGGNDPSPAPSDSANRPPAAKQPTNPTGGFATIDDADGAGDGTEGFAAPLERPLDRISIDANYDQVGRAATVTIGPGTVLRTDYGVATKFAERPQSTDLTDELGPPDAPQAFFSSAGPLESFVVDNEQLRTGLREQLFLNAFEVTVGRGAEGGLPAEEGLQIDINFRDPIDDEIAAASLEEADALITASSGRVPTNDVNSRRLQYDILVPEGGESVVIGHIYSAGREGDADTLLNEFGTQVPVIFGVSHHSSIGVTGDAISQGGVTQTVAERTLSQTTDNGLLDADSEIDGDALIDTSIDFEGGFVLFTIPSTSFATLPARPPELPDAPTIPPELPPLAPPLPPLFVPQDPTLPSLATTGSSDDYFQLRLGNVVKMERIDESIGEGLLQPQRLRDWIAEQESVVDSTGYELWLITQKSKDGVQKSIERQILRFDVADQQPIPVVDEVDEAAREARLVEFPPDEFGDPVEGAGDSGQSPQQVRGKSGDDTSTDRQTVEDAPVGEPRESTGQQGGQADNSVSRLDEPGPGESRGLAASLVVVSSFDKARRRSARRRLGIDKPR